MTFALPFPAIDPVLFQFGPIVIRWYALAYIFGLLLGWRYLRALSRRQVGIATDDNIDDFLTWATFGVILGGRLGYILFYRPDLIVDNPLAILRVWEGGMSFHGGLIGVALATLWFVRKRGINLIKFSDLVACVAPIGLFFGRIANFINGELIGRVTDVPWAIVFPRGGPEPRHPSQLYEAFFEGLVLFVVLYVLSRQEWVRRRPGILSGVFLVGYMLARSFVEFFRQPDAHIGFLSAGTTMGQWLSAPMAALGLFLIYRAFRLAPRKTSDVCPKVEL
ncbi:MAG: prolipoprotein diacylglyceryl transferase [Rhodospirillaceae bacterium]|nr:prolipoprotein diacylglyceryl transferase [Rhodospirillaceae bacterium]